MDDFYFDDDEIYELSNLEIETVGLVGSGAVDVFGGGQNIFLMKSGDRTMSDDEKITIEKVEEPEESDFDKAFGEYSESMKAYRDDLLKQFTSVDKAEGMTPAGLPEAVDGNDISRESLDGMFNRLCRGKMTEKEFLDEVKRRVANRQNLEITSTTARVLEPGTSPEHVSGVTLPPGQGRGATDPTARPARKDALAKIYDETDHVDLGSTSRMNKAFEDLSQEEGSEDSAREKILDDVYTFQDPREEAIENLKKSAAAGDPLAEFCLEYLGESEVDPGMLAISRNIEKMDGRRESKREKQWAYLRSRNLGETA